MNHSAFIMACAGILTWSSVATAGLINVPYSGNFDEATVLAEDGLPAGDYDTIGGVADVGLFQLVAGNNIFSGSIASPNDSSDAFVVEILDGYKLIGANINWGTNLPDNWTPAWPPAADYIYQNTRNENAPSWFFEESSVTPEIFTISELWDGLYGEAPKLFTAPALDVGPGIYSSIITDVLSASCAVRLVSYPDPPGSFVEQCAEALSYTMTFSVERTAAPVPVPATLALFGLGLAGLGWSRRNKA